MSLIPGDELHAVRLLRAIGAAEIEVSGGGGVEHAVDFAAQTLGVSADDLRRHWLRKLAHCQAAREQLAAEATT